MLVTVLSSYTVWLLPKYASSKKAWFTGKCQIILPIHYSGQGDWLRPDAQGVMDSNYIAECHAVASESFGRMYLALYSPDYPATPHSLSALFKQVSPFPLVDLSRMEGWE